MKRHELIQRLDSYGAVGDAARKLKQMRENNYTGCTLKNQLKYGAFEVTLATYTVQDDYDPPEPIVSRAT